MQPRAAVLPTVLVALLPAFCGTAAAQTAPGGGAENPLAALSWQRGPMTAALGELAKIEVPEGYVFLDADDTRKFLEANQNPTNGTELGTLMPAAEGQGWFVVFEFNDVGYIKDDEKDSLDADALLKSIRQGTEKGNELRKERGWDTLDIVGWQTTPHYDTRTHNLTWAILGESGGQRVVNHSTRLLGRKGYMNVDLVLTPDDLPTALPAFEGLMDKFTYESGHRYAEFRSGDKLATYGLTALVAGGAAAAAAKSGLLGKFWKIIVAGLVALGAVAKRIYTRIFGRNETVVQGPAQGTGSSS
jgi:uncharacterized membrane-anchored protein